MFPTCCRADDYTRSKKRSRRRKEALMFQDSLSEGHIYLGRFAAVLVAVTAAAYLFSQI